VCYLCNIWRIFLTYYKNNRVDYQKIYEKEYYSGNPIRTAVECFGSDLLLEKIKVNDVFISKEDYKEHYHMHLETQVKTDWLQLSVTINYNSKATVSVIILFNGFEGMEDVKNEQILFYESPIKNTTINGVYVEYNTGVENLGKAKFEYQGKVYFVSASSEKLMMDTVTNMLKAE